MPPMLRSIFRQISRWLAPLTAVFVALLMSVSPVLAAAPNSLGLAATYDAHATIGWKANTLDVVSTAHVHNDSGDDLSALTFNLALMDIGKVDVREVKVDGKSADAKIDDQSLIVRPSKAIAAGADADITVSYHAVFNTTLGGERYLFLKRDNIITAYRWIPWLSVDQPYDGHGDRESWVTAVSKHVNVTLTSDVALEFATSGGAPRSSNGKTQTFSASDVRDFNFSASPDYRVLRFNWNGIAVRVLYRNLPGQRLVTLTRQALAAYTKEVGAYAYARLDVAEFPAGTGMESPGLIWIDGSARSSQIPYFVSHEVAHEWFYGAVGNNQGTEPFLDEALAEFMSRNLLNMWQSSKCAPKALDETVWQLSKACYVQVIYIQGALYIRSYEKQVGGTAFWRGMRNYYAAYKFKIADIDAFWQTMDAASGFNSNTHKDRFPSDFPIASPTPTPTPTSSPTPTLPPTPSPTPTSVPSAAPTSSSAASIP